MAGASRSSFLHPKDHLPANYGARSGLDQHATLPALPLASPSPTQIPPASPTVSLAPALLQPLILPLFSRLHLSPVCCETRSYFFDNFFSPHTIHVSSTLPSWLRYRHVSYPHHTVSSEHTTAIDGRHNQHHGTTNNFFRASQYELSPSYHIPLRASAALPSYSPSLSF